MAGNKPQPTTWRPAEPEQAGPVVGTDDGDILIPLRRVWIKYMVKAEALDTRAGKIAAQFPATAEAIRKTAQAYRTYAVRVRLLIPNRYEENVAA